MMFSLSDSLKPKAGKSNPQSNIRVGKDGFDITFRRGSSTYTLHGYHLFVLKRVQNEFNIPALFTRKFKGIPFSILYDFEDEREYIVTVNVRKNIVESIFNGIEGLEMEYLTECLDEEIDSKTLWKYVAFPLPEQVLDYSNPSTAHTVPAQLRVYYNPESLADVYHAMRGDKAKLLVSFIPASEAELERERAFYERELIGATGSGRFTSAEERVSLPVLMSNVLASMFTTRPMHDLSKGAVYKEHKVESRPAKRDVHREYIARTIVEMCNLEKLTNDAIFRVAFAGYGENSDLLEMHFRSKFPCVREPASPSEELTYGIPQKGGDVMSGLFASNFIYFPKGYVFEEREKSLKQG